MLQLLLKITKEYKLYKGVPVYVRTHV